VSSDTTSKDELTEELMRYSLSTVKVPEIFYEARLSDFSEKIVSGLPKLRERGNLFVTGPTGTGKSHFAAAVVRDVIEEKKYSKHLIGSIIHWVLLPELLMDIRGTYHPKAVQQEREIFLYYMKFQYLVLDDLGAEKMTDWSLSTLYLIIAKRIETRRHTIVTSNLDLKQISEWEPRIQSRLGGFGVIKLGGKDRRLER
jgi:DNA replication protein DnaC